MVVVFPLSLILPRILSQEMAALPEGIARERRLVELNVVESCLNLFKTPTVQKRRVETHANADFPFTVPAFTPWCSTLR